MNYFDISYKLIDLRGKKDLNGNLVPYDLKFGCMHLRCCRAYAYDETSCKYWGTIRLDRSRDRDYKIKRN